MKKYQVITGLLTGVLLIFSLPYLSIFADSVEELQTKQQASQQKASALEEKRAEMEEALSELNSNFYELTMSMNETSEQLELCRNQLEQTNTELAEAQLLSDQYYEDMKERIRFLYENRSMNAATAFLRSGNITDFLNSVSMISDFTAYDRKMLQKYQDNQILIAKKLEELQQQETLLRDQELLFAEQQTQLFTDITNQRQQLSRTESEINTQKEISKNLQRQINAMLSYEALYDKQYNQNDDTYYLKATQNGYSPITDTASYSASSYTQNEFEILSALIYCEAGGEPYEVQLAVGSVVMNRLRSPLFPDTLLGVIYQHKQFTPVLTGRHAVVLANNLTTDSCRMAARAVLNGYSSGNWLFFRVDKEHKINGTHMGVSVFY